MDVENQVNSLSIYKSLKRTYSTVNFQNCPSLVLLKSTLGNEDPFL